MAFTHGHALIIGVGSYRFAPHLNVPITAADAEAVATALRDPRLCGYPDANVTLLANEGATRDGVLAALRTLAQRTTPADTILLFYSGHGEYSADGVYALTTHDTRFDTGGKVVTGAAVSQTDLITALRAIPAQRVLVLISPSTTVAGSGGFTLIITGTNFVTNSVVRWNGNDLTTGFVSSTVLTAIIPASDVATAGTANVTVFNPAPGGGESGAVTFTIQDNTVGSPQQYRVMLSLITR
jgi:hypothetical protein